MKNQDLLAFAVQRAEQKLREGSLAEAMLRMRQALFILHNGR